MNDEQEEIRLLLSKLDHTIKQAQREWEELNERFFENEKMLNTEGRI